MSEKVATHSDLEAVKKCILRVAGRVTRVDKRQEKLEVTMIAHAQTLEGFIKEDGRRHDNLDEAVRDFREEVRSAQEANSKSHSALHGRVDTVVKLVFGLFLSIGGIIILGLLSFIVHVAYNGWPWELS